MAKADTMFNVSSGRLVLPDGTDVAPGSEVEITKELAGNAGVRSWIAEGLLGKAMPRQAAADLASENAKLTAENAALAEKMAGMAAQIEQLNADLASATQPTE